MVPKETPEPITSETEFLEAVAHLRSAGTFAYDTEFIGEETYFPQLCLIQLSSAERIFLIDPLAIENLNPVWELIADPSLLTIVHAGHQDLEPVYRMTQTPAANVIDTQIAAGFASMPYPCSLNRLILAEAKAESGKGMTFTKWDSRPLSPMQCRYAADDVRYLPLVWSQMEGRLQQAGLLDWVKAECLGLCQPESYVPDFDSQCNRLQRNRNMRTPQRAMLHRLAQARDKAARAANMPPRALLADEVIMGLLKHRPQDMESLSKLSGMPRFVARDHGEDLIEAICSDEIPPMSPPRPRLAEETVDQRVTIDCLWSSITSIALAKGIAPALLCSRNQIAGWFLNQAGTGTMAPPDLPGWRGEFMKQELGAFLSGERTLQLAWQNDRLTLDASSD
jgi:ribonuclease D